MPDFLQSGPLLTLPLLHAADAAGMERDLAQWTVERPLVLVLPCHVRDFTGGAMRGILQTLHLTPWVQRVVIGLDGAGLEEAEAARAALPSARFTLLHRTGTAGKGACLREGLAVLSEGAAPFAVAMHDCDILHYSPAFLARLCWPVLHPGAGLHACKGYYARTSTTLHGRVFRLFLQPLLRACVECLPPHPWLTFLTSLRYPLSGELCVRASLLPELPLPDGWDAELALLSGLYTARVPLAQAELCPAYDHKHQEPAALEEMAAVLASRLLQTFVTHELLAFPRWPLDVLLSARSGAEKAVRHAALMAAMNGFTHDAGAENRLASLMLKSAGLA